MPGGSNHPGQLSRTKRGALAAWKWMALFDLWTDNCLCVVGEYSNDANLPAPASLPASAAGSEAETQACPQI
jgi:hypothetical protein